MLHQSEVPTYSRLHYLAYISMNYYSMIILDSDGCCSSLTIIKKFQITLTLNRISESRNNLQLRYNNYKL